MNEQAEFPMTRKPTAQPNPPASAQASGQAPSRPAHEPCTMHRPFRPLADILTDLAKPIPARFLRSKPVNEKDENGKKWRREITFCPWYHAQRLLDYYTGGCWEYEVREKKVIPGTDGAPAHLIITVRITITAREGTFYREGTGIERLDVRHFGDEQSNAEGMAFRRACARWGLGLHLYDKR